jgi:hypothetical protein
MNITNMPGFTAEASVYRSLRHYQSAPMGVSSKSYLDPAQLAPSLSNCRCTPGWGLCVPDATCASGGSRRLIHCDCSFGPKVCCTPTHGGGGGGNGGGVNCGDYDCPEGATCCDNPGCCPSGAFCCFDGHGCCENDQTCESIDTILFGTYYWCEPNYLPLTTRSPRLGQ